MKLGQITSYIDVAQVTLYAFWIFFAGLIFYLRREDRREGYPLMSEPGNTLRDSGFLLIPTPKTFRLIDGSTVTVGTGKPDNRAINAVKGESWPGAPLLPSGDPMLAAVGPGAFAERASRPDLSADGKPKMVPLRAASGFLVEPRDPDPRGYSVVAGDGVVAGTVSDVWVDRSEIIVRYLEVATLNNGGTVLLPITFAIVNRDRRQVFVDAIFARHFANVPRLANGDQITHLEEDKVTAYFGAGTLYASVQRAEPLL